MKFLHTPQSLLLLFWIAMCSVKSQNLIVIAPPDLVISSSYVFNLDSIKNPNDQTFGRFVFDLALRKKVVTLDYVCYKYCRKNLYTGYSGNLIGNVNPKPASKQACDYYYSYFDTAHKDRKYELVWGFDGYASGDQVKLKEIVVNDYRHCSEGLIQRIFIVEDVRRSVGRDTQNIWMVDCQYEYPITLTCEKEVYISLDSATCEVTLEAGMFLMGSGFCNGIYKIEVKPWLGVGSPLIDRNPNKAGVQLSKEDINKEFKVTIIDPVTGNSCSGRATVEYKIKPSIQCPQDITVSCLEGFLPLRTGMPSVGSNCNTTIISYKDLTQKGNCTLGYSWFIQRNWKITDDQKNFAECSQQITVASGDINQIEFPENFDDVKNPALECSQKVDSNINLKAFIKDSPVCVDGYLLDSTYWKLNSNEPDIFPNRRVPRIFGWNTKVDTLSPSGLVPSTEDQFYPSYSTIANGKLGCWSDNEYIQWRGTGKPNTSACFNLAWSYQDVYLSIADVECVGLKTNCFKLIRKWTVVDWCSGKIVEYDQIIKIVDNKSPEFNYPSTVNLFLDTLNTVEWNVPNPVLKDNCSESFYYYILSPVGKVIGNSKIGYYVREIPLGDHIVKIIASDCCGNTSEKEVLIKVHLASSVSNPIQKGFQVFPNPASNEVNISAVIPYDHIVIQSIEGNIVLKLSRQNSQRYDLSELRAGIYFIQLLSANRMIALDKLIVNK